MANAVKIDIEEMRGRCEVESILDEGESLEGFVANDDRAGFYRTQAGDKVVYFVQHSGFEFFFTEDGLPPTDFDPKDHQDTLEGNWSQAVGRNILPANDVRLEGSNGIEESAFETENGLLEIRGDATRLQLVKNGLVVAALKHDGQEVLEIHVRQALRGRGLGAELLEKANDITGYLAISPQMGPAQRALLKDQADPDLSL